ncbi:MAG: hypothetical protein WCZ26_08600, partial [Methanothrix soehngenii]
MGLEPSIPPFKIVGQPDFFLAPRYFMFAAIHTHILMNSRALKNHWSNYGTARQLQYFGKGCR